MDLRETPLGFEIDSPEYFFFFGNKSSYLENLQKAYPEFELLKLRQVHGDQIHFWDQAAGQDPPEADAHLTKQKNKGLLVVTADCLPVLMAHPKSDTVMAVHAGWRGIASRLLVKSLERLISEGAQANEIFIIIGPHIQQSSFEVGEDVKNELLAAVPTFDAATMRSLARPLIGPNRKFYVDLNALAKIQFSEVGVPPDQLLDLHLDSKTDLRFHSYRRDKETSGRNYSFVVRK